MYLLDPEVQAQFADLSAGFRAAACSLCEDLPWNEETDQEDGGDSRSVLFLDFSVSLKPTPHPLRGCRFAQVSCCNPLSVQMWGLITADCLWAHEGSTLLEALKGERHTERERPISFLYSPRWSIIQLLILHKSIYISDLIYAESNYTIKLYARCDATEGLMYACWVLMFADGWITPGRDAAHLL